MELSPTVMMFGTVGTVKRFVLVFVCKACDWLRLIFVVLVTLREALVKGSGVPLMTSLPGWEMKFIVVLEVMLAEFSWAMARSAPR